MPYIGKSPIGGGFHKLDNLTASATATYALTLGSAAYYPETANQLLVSLNGVIQAPQDSFTVSGSNLIFDSALTSSDSIDFVVALGDVLGVQGVTDGAVSTNKIANGAVTDAKIDTMAASKLTGALPASVTSSGVYLGGTGSANLLDDYEEGIWTPIFSDGTGSDKYSGYTVQSGYYRKVGSLCMCGFDILGATVTSTSGSYLTISGLPFSANPAGNPISIANIAFMQNIGHSTLQGGYVNNSHLYLTVSGTTHPNPSTLLNSARVIGGFTYITT